MRTSSSAPSVGIRFCGSSLALGLRRVGVVPRSLSLFPDCLAGMSFLGLTELDAANRMPAEAACGTLNGDGPGAFRRDRRRRRRDGIDGVLRAGAAKAPRARARAVRRPPRPRQLARPLAHDPPGLLRTPRLRPAPPPRVRELAEP